MNNTELIIFPADSPDDTFNNYLQTRLKREPDVMRYIKTAIPKGIIAVSGFFLVPVVLQPFAEIILATMSDDSITVLLIGLYLLPFFYFLAVLGKLLIYFMSYAMEFVDYKKFLKYHGDNYRIEQS